MNENTLVVEQRGQDLQRPTLRCSSDGFGRSVLQNCRKKRFSRFIGEHGSGVLHLSEALLIGEESVEITSIRTPQNAAPAAVGIIPQIKMKAYISDSLEQSASIATNTSTTNAYPPDAQTPKTMTDSPIPFLTTPEVARIFGVTSRTISSWMQRGLLPYFRIRHTCRFSAVDIQKCMETNYRMAGKTV